jgi:hypothetical protein
MMVFSKYSLGYVPENGGSGVIRTPDQGIMIPLLYH